MSANAVYVIRGGVECHGKAGLAKHGTTHTNLVTANAVDYSIDGKFYNLAAQANIAPTALPVQADLTTALYIVLVNAAGTITQVQSPVIVTADLTTNTNSLKFPNIAEGLCPIAYYKVATSGLTFTNGTTALNAAGLTVTYVDVALLGVDSL